MCLPFHRHPQIPQVPHDRRHKPPHYERVDERGHAGKRRCHFVREGHVPGRVQERLDSAPGDLNGLVDRCPLSDIGLKTLGSVERIRGGRACDLSDSTSEQPFPEETSARGKFRGRPTMKTPAPDLRPVYPWESPSEVSIAETEGAVILRTVFHPPRWML